MKNRRYFPPTSATSSSEVKKKWSRSHQTFPMIFQFHFISTNTRELQWKYWKISSRSHVWIFWLFIFPNVIDFHVCCSFFFRRENLKKKNWETNFKYFFKMRGIEEEKLFNFPPKITRIFLIAFQWPFSLKWETDEIDSESESLLKLFSKFFFIILFSHLEKYIFRRGGLIELLLTTRERRKFMKFKKSRENWKLCAWKVFSVKGSEVWSGVARWAVIVARPTMRTTKSTRPYPDRRFIWRGSRLAQCEENIWNFPDRRKCYEPIQLSEVQALISEWIFALLSSSSHIS